MTWQPPKTDWRSIDTFSLAPDYARLQNNLQALQQMAAPLYTAIVQQELPLYTEADWPVAEFFNAVENSIAQLVLAIGLLPHYMPRTLAAGEAVWRAEDLNRMENALQFLHTALHAARRNAPHVSFTLGGEDFG